MNKEQIIIIGSSGHAKVIIDIIEKSNQYEIAGLTNANPINVEKVLGYNILGTDDDLLINTLCSKCVYNFYKKYKIMLTTIPVYSPQDQVSNQGSGRGISRNARQPRQEAAQESRGRRVRGELWTVLEVRVRAAD